MRQAAGARMLTIADLSQLAGALEYAGLPADRFDDGGPAAAGRGCCAGGAGATRWR